MKFIVISGLSGAGKSVMLQTLEDHHFYCIDNMPLEFLDELSKQLSSKQIRLGERIAVSIDTRNLTAQSIYIKLISERLEAAGFNTKLVFLRASEEVLEHRYNETRRPHPLSIYGNKPLRECIKSEITLLDEVASNADTYIDTTDMSRYELQNTITGQLALDKVPMSILLKSFGYKKGIPTNSDYIFDVRCLANPYWVSHLRMKLGTDSEVQSFLEQSPRSMELFNDIFGFLKKWFSHYESDIRSYLTVSVGCTGGRHRSVYMVEKLYRRFREEKPEYDISKEHRDL